MKTFNFLILTIAWIFNKIVYRLCFTEHQNFSGLSAKNFWSFWFFNKKSSQHCLLSARIIKGDFYNPHFLTTNNFCLVYFVLNKKVVSKSNAPKKFCSGRSGSRAPFPIVVSKFHQSFCSGIPQISLSVHILHSIFTKRQINLPKQCLHVIQIFTGLNFKLKQYV